MSDKDWQAKCGGMFLGLLGAVNLARLLGLDPHLMLDMLMLKLDEAQPPNMPTRREGA